MHPPSREARIPGPIHRKQIPYPTTPGTALPFRSYARRQFARRRPSHQAPRKRGDGSTRTVRAPQREKSINEDRIGWKRYAMHSSFFPCDSSIENQSAPQETVSLLVYQPIGCPILGELVIKKGSEGARYLALPGNLLHDHGHAKSHAITESPVIQCRTTVGVADFPTPDFIDEARSLWQKN